MTDAIERFSLTSEELEAYSEVQAYKRLYVSKTFDADEWMQSFPRLSGVMVSIVATVMAPVMFSESMLFGFLALIPVTATVGGTVGYELFDRNRYRKNRRREKILRNAEKRFLNWIKDVYNVDMSGHLSGLMEHVFESENADASVTIQDRETHNTDYVTVKYVKKTGVFSLIDSRRKVIPPRKTLTAPARTLQLEQVKPSTPQAAEYKLSELIIPESQLNTLPRKLREEVSRFSTIYTSLMSVSLTVEESHAASRAIQDLQDSLTMYNTAVRLAGAGSEQVAYSIVVKLVEELSQLQKKKLSAVTTALETQHVYVTSRA